MSEVKKGKIPWNKGKTGIYSEETLEKMKESKKGKQCGQNNPNYGKKHSAETRKKISETKTGKPKVTCPHCGKIGGIGNIKRYHNDNCKMKI